MSSISSVNPKMEVTPPLNRLKLVNSYVRLLQSDKCKFEKPD